MRPADHLHLGGVGERRPTEVHGEGLAPRHTRGGDRRGHPSSDAPHEHERRAAAPVRARVPGQLCSQGVRLRPVPAGEVPRQSIQGTAPFTGIQVLRGDFFL